MRSCYCWALGFILALAGAGSAAPPTLDELLTKENAGRKVQQAPLVDDLGFLRRVSIDLTGRIPTDAEIQKFLALPAGERRQKLIDDLLQRPEFADRWTVFFADMMRVRSYKSGGQELQALIHRAIEENQPYDATVRGLIGAGGKVGVSPEIGFIFGDDVEPMALTGSTAQVFLGIRMSCAECHDHPFDKWTRKQFYGLAAYYGKTRRIEDTIGKRILRVRLNEDPRQLVMWPPENKANGKPRTAVKPTFPFELDGADGPHKHLARLAALREQQARAEKVRKPSVDELLGDAEKKLDPKSNPDALDVDKEAKSAARKLNVEKDIYKVSELRTELAKLITDPRNRAFSRNLVNRIWAELLGRGFVNPVDDFRADNPASHAQTLDFLADEFVAGGYDFRALVRMVVSTQAYQRAHLPATVDPVVRRDSQHAFVAATARRMNSETLYDSIVQAGHLFNVKHHPGQNRTVIRETVLEFVPEKGADLTELKPKNPMAMTAPKAPTGGGYDLERSIEVDYKSVLAKRTEAIQLDAMQKMSPEEMEAEQMMGRGEKKGKVVKHFVERTIDDNPKFTSSMRMASPAPVGHFLRVFGQTDRGSLDDRRDHTPSMRQALMMLNGRLTNEAARVGALEPMYRLVSGPNIDLDRAIRLAYREALTREPNAQEITEAHEIIKGAATPVEGMADLRWALFNCHEFRYLP